MTDKTKSLRRSKNMKFSSWIVIFFVTNISPSELTDILDDGSIKSSINSMVYRSEVDSTSKKIDFKEFGERMNHDCETITIPMCRGIGYNYTRMPNELNHDTQEEAGLEVHQFWPLVEIKCSPDLKFFLCSMYTPICLPEYPKPLTVCRSVCERARTGCAPLMLQYGFSWPERMACERLPNFGDSEHLCMERDNWTISSPDMIPQSSSQSPLSIKQNKPTRSQQSKCKIGKNQKNCSNDFDKEECTCACRKPLVKIPSLSNKRNNHTDIEDHLPMNFNTAHINTIGDIIDCMIPCEGIFSNLEQRHFTNIWLRLWSGVCSLSTLITIITFLIDRQRFQYPEKPIVILSFCYFFVSLGYLIRSILGHKSIACTGNILLNERNSTNLCILVFSLIYFFGMASSIWWVVLALSWFLAAGLKWGNEAIASYSHYFHLVAWLIPSAQTVYALISEGTIGDPVGGICTIPPAGVRLFIISPLIIYLLLGTKFLLAGFISLFRIRSAIKNQPGVKTDKLEKLMMRIGIFSVLYTVPASIILACHIYELKYRNDWLISIACPCKMKKKPLYPIFMLKYFMILAVGITSGVWVWSGKTITSWRKFWAQSMSSKETHIRGIKLSNDRQNQRIIPKIREVHSQTPVISNFPSPLEREDLHSYQRRVRDQTSRHNFKQVLPSQV